MCTFVHLSHEQWLPRAETSALVWTTCGAFGQACSAGLGDDIHLLLRTHNCTPRCCRKDFEDSAEMVRLPCNASSSSMAARSSSAPQILLKPSSGQLSTPWLRVFGTSVSGTHVKAWPNQATSSSKWQSSSEDQLHSCSAERMWLPRGRKDEASEYLLDCLGPARAGSRRAVVVVVLVVSAVTSMAITSDAHTIASHGSIYYTIGYHKSRPE